MRKSKDGVEPLQRQALDDFLNSKSIFTLQGLLRRWTGSVRAEHSKTALIRELRPLMLSRHEVERKLKELPNEAVSLLRHIIKGAPPSSPTELRHLLDLEELAIVGPSWPTNDIFAPRPTIIVPEELKALLVEILDIDTRPVDQAISLEVFLKSMPPDQYDRTVDRVLGKAGRDGTIETDIRLLTDPASILERIKKLPKALQNAIPKAITTDGGVCPCDTIRNIGSREIRFLLEEQLIGSVTELPLEWLGLGGHLAVAFTEITESALSGMREEPPPGSVLLSRGTAALSDMNAILAQLGFEGARRKQDRSVYRGSLKRLAGFLGPIEGWWAREQTVEVYLGILEGLRLVSGATGELAPTEEADSWFEQTPEEQLGTIASKLGRVASPAIPHLWEKAMKLIRELQPGEVAGSWAVHSRLVVSILRDSVRERNLDRLLLPVEDMRELPGLLNGWMLVLAHYGIIDVHLIQDTTVAALQLSEAGSCALGRAPVPSFTEDEKIVIVNPDFEAIIFRHGPAWRVAALLSRFAQRGKVDQTYHFRLTRQSVEGGVLRGMTGDSILQFLRDHTRTPIPQNVEYSIRDWAGHVRVARSFQGIVLEVKEPHTLDALMEDPKIKPYILRRLGPTLAFLRSRITNKKIIEQLRESGIFLQN